jgi:hypothetical protein
MQIRKHIYFRFTITLIILTFFPFVTIAQRGTLKGKVIDEQTKKPIPNALVKLINYSEFNVYHFDTTKTDINGEYCFSYIPVGKYFVLIKSDNYFYNNKDNVSIYKNVNAIICNELHIIPKSDGTWNDDGDIFDLFPLKRIGPSGQTYTSEEINKMAW